MLLWRAEPLHVDMDITVVARQVVFAEDQGGGAAWLQLFEGHTEPRNHPLDASTRGYPTGLGELLRRVDIARFPLADTIDLLSIDGSGTC